MIDCDFGGHTKTENMHTTALCTLENLHLLNIRSVYLLVHKVESAFKKIGKQKREN